MLSSKSGCSKTFLLVTAGIFGSLLGGCGTNISGASPSTTASAGKLSEPPVVQECALVSTSSPSKYVCNGKTYTAHELMKMRADYDAQVQALK